MVSVNCWISSALVWNVDASQVTDRVRGLIWERVSAPRRGLIEPGCPVCGFSRGSSSFVGLGRRFWPIAVRFVVIKSCHGISVDSDRRVTKLKRYQDHLYSSVLRLPLIAPL